MRRLDGLLQGDYRTLLRGAGVDLADLREYQYHDDVRHIDWNVTARLQPPHVRQFTEDRELTAWFLLDLSGSVDFGSADVTKLAVSRRLRGRAGAGAHAPRQPRRRAALRPARSTRVLPPRLSRLHVLHLLQRMRQRAAAPARAAAAPRWPNCCNAAAGAHQAPLAGVRGVRLHQPARLGGRAGAAGAAPRGGGGAPVRPAGDGAARPRPGDGGRRRNRRTAVRRHPDPAFRERYAADRRRRARPRCATAWRTPAPTRWSWPPTTTCSTRCCALPTCAASARGCKVGGALSGAPAHATRRRTPAGSRAHDLHLARPCCGCCCCCRCWCCCTCGCCASASADTVRLASLARGQGGAGQGPGLAPPRAAGCCCCWPSAALLLAMARPMAVITLPLAAAHHHPGDGRVGQHARRPTSSPTAWWPRRRRPRPSSPTCRARCASAWCRSPAPPRWCRRPPPAART